MHKCMGFRCNRTHYGCARVRAAYADPPYPGQAQRHYNCAEIDHKYLLEYLYAEYDAWALSSGSISLGYLLGMCPWNVRVASWVKPFSNFKPNVNPGYTWEPVIFFGGRKRDRYEPTIKDHIIENITLKKGLVGAKPKTFCFWLFNLLGLKSNDIFDDLFPGTGVVTECWKEYQARPKLPVLGQLL